MTGNYEQQTRRMICDAGFFQADGRNCLRCLKHSRGSGSGAQTFFCLFGASIPARYRHEIVNETEQPETGCLNCLEGSHVVVFQNRPSVLDQILSRGKNTANRILKVMSHFADSLLAPGLPWRDLLGKRQFLRVFFRGASRPCMDRKLGRVPGYDDFGQSLLHPAVIPPAAKGE